jgi:8-oxo-dGTP pyrophosphatase MutT (NUDIX family)
MGKKIMTLCCVYNDTHILLGEIKKNGELKGRYNGFGGKMEEGETIEQAAERELYEECGIIPLDMKKKGVILFEFEEEGNPFAGNSILEVHIYSVTKFKGEPVETDEMRPQWFLHSEIPFESMWPDDPLWFPMLLNGKNFEGKFKFKDKDTIIESELIEK